MQEEAGEDVTLPLLQTQILRSKNVRQGGRGDSLAETENRSAPSWNAQSQRLLGAVFQQKIADDSVCRQRSMRQRSSDQRVAVGGPFWRRRRSRARCHVSQSSHETVRRHHSPPLPLRVCLCLGKGNKAHPATRSVAARPHTALG